LSLLLDAVSALKRAEDHFAKKKRQVEYVVEMGENTAITIKRLSAGGTSGEDAAAAAAVDTHSMDISIVSTGLCQLLNQIKMDTDMKTRIYDMIMSSLTKKTETRGNKQLKRLYKKKTKSSKNVTVAESESVGVEVESWDETEDDQGFELAAAAAAAAAAKFEDNELVATAAAAAVEFEMSETATEAAAAAVAPTVDAAEGANEVTAAAATVELEMVETATTIEAAVAAAADADAAEGAKAGVTENNKNSNEKDNGDAPKQLPSLVKSVVGAVMLRSKSRSPGFGGDVLSTSVIFEDEQPGEKTKDPSVWYEELVRETCRGQEPPAVLEDQELPSSLPVLEMADEDILQQQQQQQHNNTIVLSSNNSSILTLPLSGNALSSPFFSLDKQGATPLINSTPVDTMENNRNPNPVDLKQREEEERMIRKKRALWIQKREIAQETANLVLPTLLSKIDELLYQRTHQQQQQQLAPPLYNYHHYQQQQQQQEQHHYEYDPCYSGYNPTSRIPAAKLPGKIWVCLLYSYSVQEGGGEKVLKSVEIVSICICNCFKKGELFLISYS
jgi:hypothetical protein